MSTAQRYKIYKEASLDVNFEVVGYIAFLLTVFAFYYGSILLGSILIVVGFSILSITQYVIIDFEEGTAKTYQSFLFFTSERTSQSIDLNNFNKCILYQKSDIATAVFRSKRLYHKSREYWIQLTDKDGENVLLGYLKDYSKMSQIVLLFKSKLRYETRDVIQERLKSNQANYKERKRNLFSNGRNSNA